MERLHKIIGLTVIFAGFVVASALTIAEWLAIRRENERKRREQRLRRLENVITGSGGSHG